MGNQTKGNQLAGVIGYFDDPDALIHATEKVRDANYENFDAFTPYPVHGLNAAQGLKRSPLPFVTMAAGMTGCTLGFLLQYWTSVIDWPLIVGGKPLNSWPAFVPIMFECTILFAGLSTVAAMFLFNGLPNHHRKAFDPRLTRDRFALLIEAPLELEEDEEESENAKKKAKKFKPFTETEAQEFLKKIGATGVKSVYTEGWF
jgi:hypothetical protein